MNNSATTDRFNDLAIEYTQTVLDTANFVQRQNAALIQSWFTTLESNQQTGRELVRKAMQQAQEARTLWVQLAQETFRASTDTFTRAAGTQLREMSEQIDTAGQQVKNGARKSETAAAK
jgi:polyhydroxyalkanoate synthesis regulator phasin